MAESRKPPTPSPPDPLPEEDEEQGPISGARPSSPPADPSKLEEDPPIIDDAPVTDDEEDTPPVTTELRNDRGRVRPVRVVPPVFNQALRTEDGRPLK